MLGSYPPFSSVEPMDEVSFALIFSVDGADVSEAPSGASIVTFANKADMSASVEPRSNFLFSLTIMRVESTLDFVRLLQDDKI